MPPFTTLELETIAQAGWYAGQSDYDRLTWEQTDLNRAQLAARALSEMQRSRLCAPFVSAPLAVQVWSLNYLRSFRAYECRAYEFEAAVWPGKEDEPRWPYEEDGHA